MEQIKINKNANASLSKEWRLFNDDLKVWFPEHFKTYFELEKFIKEFRENEAKNHLQRTNLMVVNMLFF